MRKVFGQKENPTTGCCGAMFPKKLVEYVHDAFLAAKVEVHDDLRLCLGEVEGAVALEVHRVGEVVIHFDSAEVPHLTTGRGELVGLEENAIDTLRFDDLIELELFPGLEEDDDFVVLLRHEAYFPS